MPTIPVRDQIGGCLYLGPSSLSRAVRESIAAVREAKGGKGAKASSAGHWITIHPHGLDAKGQPVLIRDDGTVLGGMGGTFNGRKLGALYDAGAHAGPSGAQDRYNPHAADNEDFGPEYAVPVHGAPQHMGGTFHAHVQNPHLAAAVRSGHKETAYGGRLEAHPSGSGVLYHGPAGSHAKGDYTAFAHEMAVDLGSHIHDHLQREHERRMADADDPLAYAYDDNGSVKDDDLPAVSDAEREAYEHEALREMHAQGDASHKEFKDAIKALGGLSKAAFTDSKGRVGDEWTTLPIWARNAKGGGHDIGSLARELANTHSHLLPGVASGGYADDQDATDALLERLHALARAEAEAGDKTVYGINKKQDKSRNRQEYERTHQEQVTQERAARLARHAAGQASRLARKTGQVVAAGVREAASGAGHWITLHAHGTDGGEDESGTVHVYIGAGGRVEKGPRSLLGGHIGHLADHSHHTTHHPEGREPAGARAHPSYAEHERPEPKPGKPYARDHGAEQTRQEQGPPSLSRAEARAGLEKAREAQTAATRRAAPAKKVKAPPPSQDAVDALDYQVRQHKGLVAGHMALRNEARGAGDKKVAAQHDRARIKAEDAHRKATAAREEAVRRSGLQPRDPARPDNPDQRDRLRALQDQIIEHGWTKGIELSRRVHNNMPEHIKLRDLHGQILPEWEPELRDVLKSLKGEGYGAGSGAAVAPGRSDVARGHAQAQQTPRFTNPNTAPAVTAPTGGASLADTAGEGGIQPERAQAQGQHDLFGGTQALPEKKDTRTEAQKQAQAGQQSMFRDVLGGGVESTVSPPSTAPAGSDRAAQRRAEMEDAIRDHHAAEQRLKGDAGLRMGAGPWRDAHEAKAAALLRYEQRYGKEAHDALVASLAHQRAREVAAPRYVNPLLAR